MGQIKGLQRLAAEQAARFAATVEAMEAARGKLQELQEDINTKSGTIITQSNLIYQYRRKVGRLRGVLDEPVVVRGDLFPDEAGITEEEIAAGEARRAPQKGKERKAPKGGKQGKAPKAPKGGKQGKAAKHRGGN